MYNINNNRIIHYVETFNDVCLMLNINIDKFNEYCIGLNKGEIAYRKLILIIKVLNENWIPKLDGKEYMYTIRWQFNKEDGSFSYRNYNGWHTRTFVGLGLGFKNEILAKYCAEQFVEIWNDYLKYNTNEFLNTFIQWQEKQLIES